MDTISKTLTTNQAEEELRVLEVRFKKNMPRHKDLDWTDIETKLKTKPEKLWSLYEMERTGGEPDVVSQDQETGEYLFYDCAAESPKGRRSLCYDRDAHEARKEYKPASNVLDEAAAMGIMLLTEQQYSELQKIGNFDLKTSSWVKTPDSVRQLGGAIFCDRRYNRVFTYHNGADSYYAARGFRGSLRI
jgi:ribonuclease D